ncbi:hypothetical protein EYF80_013791 [Liparis tanakae]|uniref:Uncharacterized protein n=1 Tax=Liparis tanakae TaxID=230148 RepID=A0A4Z2IDF2_9TELE|nr:hypothetical protein EYF80_013791 [Liparis tanakae]
MMRAHLSEAGLGYQHIVLCLHTVSESLGQGITSISATVGHRGLQQVLLSAGYCDLKAPPDGLHNGEASFDSTHRTANYISVTDTCRGGAASASHFTGTLTAHSPLEGGGGPLDRRSWVPAAECTRGQEKTQITY